MPANPKSSVVSSEEPPLKKQKQGHDGEASSSFMKQVNKTRDQALEILICQLDRGTEAIYKNLYGEHWREGMKYETEKLEAAQRERRELNAEVAESARKRKEKETVSLRGTGVFLDDIDPRY
jgi:chromatin structure-remodeling complex subunit RSC1/2